MTKPTLNQALIDRLARDARAALADAEQQLQAVNEAAKTGLLAVRAYGAALHEIRRVTPSDKRFGQLVKQQALDVGLAANPNWRTDAVWVHQEWDNLASHASELAGISNPVHLRQVCRGLGHSWAFQRQRLHQQPSKFGTNPFKQKRVIDPVPRLCLAEQQQRQMHALMSAFEGGYAAARSILRDGYLRKPTFDEIRDLVDTSSKIVEALENESEVLDDEQAIDAREALERQATLPFDQLH